ncbi:MAG: hypothetical protein GX799_09280 [Crenarchaeota archaeon]|nr:hypothetical protein [Thermoproteota archaeon]
MIGDWIKLITSAVYYAPNMKPGKLSVRSTKEILQVPDEPKKPSSKTKNPSTPTSSGNTNELR